jgi:hypothetical protein
MNDGSICGADEALPFGVRSVVGDSWAWGNLCNSESCEGGLTEDGAGKLGCVCLKGELEGCGEIAWVDGREDGRVSGFDVNCSAPGGFLS